MSTLRNLLQEKLQDKHDLLAGPSSSSAAGAAGDSGVAHSQEPPGQSDERNHPNHPNHVDVVDAQDLLTYLRSARKHRELMERYHPTVHAGQLDRVKMTANRVGLELPKAFMDVLALDKEQVAKERLTNSQ